MSKNEMVLPIAEFTDKTLKFLLGEVIRLRVEVSKLKHDDPEAMADDIVKFMQSFLEIFPEENHDQLRQAFLKGIGVPSAGQSE